MNRVDVIFKEDFSQIEDFGMITSAVLAASLLLPSKAPEKLPEVNGVSGLQDTIVEKCIEAKKSGDIKTANYYDLMQATIKTESSWNKDAFNPKGGGKGAVGLFQIRQTVINDVNRVYKTNYTIQDAYDINKAAEIYRLYYNIQCGYLKHYKPGTTTNIIDMSKIYNQGCGVLTSKASEASKKNATNYWKKVSSNLALPKSRK